MTPTFHARGLEIYQHLDKDLRCLIEDHLNVELDQLKKQSAHNYQMLVSSIGFYTEYTQLAHAGHYRAMTHSGDSEDDKEEYSCYGSFHPVPMIDLLSVAEVEFGTVCDVCTKFRFDEPPCECQGELLPVYCRHPNWKLTPVT